MGRNNPDGDSGENSKPVNEGYMRVSWRAVTVCLALVAVAVLATLVVVVSIQDVDLLSTVALALAVLAFAAQLLVSLLQSNAQAQQLSATERVNNETRALLSDISARSEALLSNQTGMFNKVLEYAMQIREAVADAAAEAGLEDGTSSSDDAPEAYERFRELVEDNVDRIRRELLAEQRSRAVGLLGRESEESPELARFHERNRAWAAKVSSFPDEDEGRRAFNLLSQLTADQRTALIRRGTEDLVRARRGSVPGNMVRWPDSELLPLVNLGLLRVNERVNKDGRAMVRWTDDGVAVLRLLLPRGEAPDWLRSLRQQAGQD